MRTASILALALFVLVLSPGYAASTGVFGCPITIDDFTQGALPLANGPFDFTHVGLPPQSCALGSRQVIINDVPTHTAGHVPLGGGDLGFQINTEEHAPGNNVIDDADVVLNYEMDGTIDLTAGGKNDRLMIQVVSVSFIDVFIQFRHAGGWVGTTKILTAGPNAVMFSEISHLVDLTQITGLAFYFHEYSTSGFGELTMSRIRCEGNLLRPLYWRVPELIEYGPPFPLPGPYMESVYINEGREVFSISPAINIRSGIQLPVSPIGAQPFPVEVSIADNGVEGGPGGLAGGFEVAEGVLGKGGVLQDGVFEISMDLWEGGEFFPMQTIVSEEVSIPAGGLFYIPFEVKLADQTGFPVGSNFYNLRVQVPAGVPYEFRNITLFPAKADGPQFDVQFELRWDGTAATTISRKDQGQALFNVTLEGEFGQDFQTTDVTLAAGQTTVMSAWPSVVSDRTLLRFDRPVDGGGMVRVYDLAGRVVREMSVPSGATNLAWDTRDGNGASVASGVYVARLEAGRNQATRKLTVVR